MQVSIMMNMADYPLNNLVIEFQFLSPTAKCPTQAQNYDAGYDLYADSEFDLLPGQRALIKTGISMAIPPGYYGRIAPRSGLALKYGIDVLAGVVDSTYRGELGVILINLGESSEVFSVRRGMRVAQLIIEKCHSVYWMAVTELPETARSSGGFGSSGTH